MTRLLCLAAFMTLPATRAFARDSSWLLCTGAGVAKENPERRHGIVVSLFDERYKVVHRLDSITLLLGGRRFEGQLVDFEIDQKQTKPMSLELKEAGKTMFQGQIRLSLSSSSTTLTLTGKIHSGYDTTQELVPYEATLSCKDMSVFGED